MRFADEPFVNRLERWPVARSCSFVRPDDHFTIAGGQWPNHPAGLSGAAKHSDCSNWKLVPCTTVAIVFKLEGNVIGD